MHISMVVFSTILALGQMTGRGTYESTGVGYGPSRAEALLDAEEVAQKDEDRPEGYISVGDPDEKGCFRTDEPSKGRRWVCTVTVTYIFDQ